MKIVFILTVVILTSAFILTFAPAKKIADSGIELLAGGDSLEIKNDSTRIRIERWLKNSAAEAKKRMDKFFKKTGNTPKASVEDLVKKHLGDLKKIDSEFGKMIQEKANKSGVRKKIAIALAASESSGRPNAIHVNDNKSIDRGLFGLNDHGAGAGLTPEEMFNPEKNTEIALNALSALIKKYQDEKTAIIAYKIGWGTVDSLMEKNQFNKNNYSVAEAVMRLSANVKTQGE